MNKTVISRCCDSPHCRLRSTVVESQSNHGRFEVESNSNRSCSHRNICNIIQEIELSLTNPSTHVCNMQWRGWPSKTRPSPYLLPRPVWSFYVEGCKHKWREPKIEECRGSTRLGWKAWLTTRNTPSRTYQTRSFCA